MHVNVMCAKKISYFGRFFQWSKLETTTQRHVEKINMIKLLKVTISIEFQIFT